MIVLLAVIGYGLFHRQKTADQAPITIIQPVEVENPDPPKPPPPRETAESGHWHGDEWHADPHETHQTPAVSAGQSYIPEGAAVTPNFPPVDPNADPIEEAYKRLEYIKNNPYAWGGVHSDRATELIAELMPPPVLMDHADSDRVDALMEELLVQGDPRAAEVIITTICEGSMAGHSMFEMLVKIGPPAVPYILPYLRKEGNVWSGMAAQFLARIAVAHRTDLGIIVDYLIIPKIAAIAADEQFQRYGSGTVIDARKALAMLQQ